MLRSWKLGRVFDIDLFVHWSFLLIPALVVYDNLSRGLGAMAALAGAIVVFGVFGCVILHELGHALAARSFGIGTRDITLYPIGGVARLERMPKRPFAELAIALAGPLVNVVIAGGLWLGFDLAGHHVLLDRHLSGSTAYLMLSQLFLANVILVAFNMIPAFPMDGGRVLRASLGFFLDYLSATEAAVVVGRVCAIGFIALPVLASMYEFPFQPPFMLAIIGLFVLAAGAQELAVARYQEMHRVRPVEQEPLRPAERFVTIESEVPPGWSGFTWDPQAGLWIQWRNGVPVSATPGSPSA